ncbi:MAG: hypothetical protein E3J72_05940 [Planctomycetota bacterium]|nr:MAG: hypothetical protein E3J72_05940 [Planctomycetota bacterium]
MHILFALLAKKNDGDTLTTIIFIVVAAIIAIVGYIKKKMAEGEQAAGTPTDVEEEDTAEAFYQYLEKTDEEEEEAEVRPHIVVEPSREKRRPEKERSWRRRAGKRDRIVSDADLESAREPIGTTHRLVEDALAPGAIDLAAATVAMAEPVDLMKALPDRLTPNQKAIVLMEILSPPKGMEGL